MQFQNRCVSGLNFADLCGGATKKKERNENIKGKGKRKRMEISQKIVETGGDLK